MNNDEMLKNSICFMGPKAVGKTLISKAITKKLGYTYINLDTIYAHIQRMCACDSFEDYTTILKHDRLNALSTLEYSCATRRLNYFKECDMLFDMEQLYNYLWYDTSWIPVIEKLSLNSQMFISQIENVQALDYIISKMRAPYVFDLGGHVGVNINVPKSDLHFIEQYFQASYKDLKEFQFRTIKKIGVRVFLMPGQNYLQCPCEDIHDEVNDLLLHKLDSYNTLSNMAISTNGIFHNFSDPMFEKRGSNDIDGFLNRDKNKNQSEIQNICDEIIYRRQELQAEEMKE